ncbi:hypothetical protein [Psilogramma increta granulovirus]|uniref:Uncharacterized protein n=1 Tax=Psilogramma increta granulovirus TaxID=2953508 RepID=A0A977XU53_9BBAC|nr:hypothetical protein [Psilogramma increta granulovirus]
MNAIFEKKNIFLQLVKQLCQEDLNLLKPQVDIIHKLIDLYCLTNKNIYLNLLDEQLKKCNTAITYRLIENNNKKYSNLCQLYCIQENIE